MRFSPLAPVAVAVSLAAFGVAQAATIEARDAWIRTPPPGAPTAAGYVTITNHGIASDRLTGAATSSAASVAPHHMSIAHGVMSMRPAVGGLPIGASATLRLSPSGDHLMLMGLKAPLRAGQHVRMLLQFQRAGNVAVDFTVRDAAPGGMHM
ncbi:MAG TPA: copper chaperone PCu(A)C [Caulobacteraceae bacterium]|nr:copper chaperone PCu(A)C [Caulobacteraceae bacterium]